MVDFCEWCHRHICQECTGLGEDTDAGWFCSYCIKDVDIRKQIEDEAGFNIKLK